MHWMHLFIADLLIVILLFAISNASGADVTGSDEGTTSIKPVVRHYGCLIRTISGSYVGPCQAQTTTTYPIVERQRTTNPVLTALLWLLYARQVRNSRISDWGEWGPCSVNCGLGTRRRSRSCGSLEDCTSEETEKCESPCTEGWGGWSPQGSCSATCREDRGLQRYTRQCGSISGCVGNDERYGWCTGEAECPFNVEGYCLDQDGLVYSGICYTIPSVSQIAVTYNDAVALCEETGALLADVHDRNHQATLKAFALTKKPFTRSYIYLFVGTAYIPSTSKLVYRSGMEKDRTVLDWTQSYPVTPSSATYLALHEDVDPTLQTGMFNIPITETADGAICERGP